MSETAKKRTYGQEIGHSRLPLGEYCRAIGADRPLGRTACRRSSVGSLVVGRLGKLVPEHASPPLVELAAGVESPFSSRS